MHLRRAVCELAILLCLISAVRSQALGRFITNPADLDRVYSEKVKQGEPDVYRYNLTVDSNEVQAIRINTLRNNASEEAPLFVVVRQKQGVVSWSLPLMVDAGVGIYANASRTACPNMTRDPNGPRSESLYVDVSTTSPTNISYELLAHKVENFTLSSGSPFTTYVTPSAPLFFIYYFQPGETDVRVLVDAEEEDKDYCSIVSVQTADCPVYDLGRDIQYRGDYQTMTTKAGVLVQRSDFPSGAFVVVVGGLSDSSPCFQSGASTWPSKGVKAPRRGEGQYYVKELTIHVEDALAVDEYTFPILMTIAFFLGIYLIVISFLIYSWYQSRSAHSLSAWLTGSAYIELDGIPSSGEDAQRNLHHGRTYGAVRNAERDNGNGGISEGSSLLTSGLRSLQEDERELSHSSALFDVRDSIAMKSIVTVEDLARKSPIELYKKYRMYPWLITTVAIFYALPVVQLVMAYQKILNDSGDQDTCYYNFRCIHPLGTVSAFNNVFSNIGYILLGFLFILITYRRSRLFARMINQDPDLLTSKGIPQHYGLFYALGIALITEGVMSGCYHVCPNGANFQFDTSFMYIIAGLCILKLYQNRHPDISARAHTTLACFAGAIVVAVFGVLYNSVVFWVIFFVLYLIAIYLVSHHMYYFGAQSFCEPCRALQRSGTESSWKDRLLAFLRPRFIARFCFVVIAVVVNIAGAIFGVSTQRDDFASYFLGVLVVNLAIYMIYYIVMKIVNKETVRMLTVVSMIVSAAMWGGALYFFLQGLTNWQASPAKSREGNSPCIIMDFYDHHDVWHFLSGFGLFFTLLALLTLDDDVIAKPRSELVVF